MKVLQEFQEFLSQRNISVEEVTDLEPQFKVLVKSVTMMDKTARYYVTTSMLTGRGEKVALNGVQENLGFFKNEFDFAKSYEIIPGVFRILAVVYCRKFLEFTTILAKDSRLVNRSILFSMRYPVEDRFGKVWHQRQFSLVKTIDRHDNILSTLNICTLKPIDRNTPIVTRPELLDWRGGTLDFEQMTNDLIESARPEILERIANADPAEDPMIIPKLSPRELVIAKMEVFGFNSSDIAKELNILQGTVYDYNKRILGKVRTSFPCFLFTTSQQAATYLDDIGII